MFACLAGTLFAARTSWATQMLGQLAVPTAKRMGWSTSRAANAGVAQPDRISGCRVMLGQLAVPSAERMGW